MSSLRNCLERIEARFDELGPELQRCARWVADHPRDVGLLSMRQQAAQIGATPTSMVRLARALGYADYTAFRAPFRDALANPVPDFRDKAKTMQAGAGTGRGAAQEQRLHAAQSDNLLSSRELNSAAAVAAAVAAIGRARRVAFLGVRSCFAISYHFHYAYSLIADNGILIHGLGGAFVDELDVLTDNDLLVCITQQPYGRPAIEAVQSCAARAVPVLALTDSPLSPALPYARHSLLYRADLPSYFQSMLGSLALVERLLAQLATAGGQPVLDRLSQVQARLGSSKAYWTPTPPRKRKP